MIDTLALFLLGALFCVSFATNVVVVLAVRWWFKRLGTRPADALTEIFRKSDRAALAGHVFRFTDEGKLLVEHPAHCGNCGADEPA